MAHNLLVHDPQPAASLQVLNLRLRANSLAVLQGQWEGTGAQV